MAPVYTAIFASLIWLIFTSRRIPLPVVAVMMTAVAAVTALFLYG